MIIIFFATTTRNLLILMHSFLLVIFKVVAIGQKLKSHKLMVKLNWVLKFTKAQGLKTQIRKKITDYEI